MEHTKADVHTPCTQFFGNNLCARVRTVVSVCTPRDVVGLASDAQPPRASHLRHCAAPFDSLGSVSAWLGSVLLTGVLLHRPA